MIGWISWFIVGLCVGLYAGKRRAQGAGWGTIGSDMGRSFVGFIVGVFRWVSAPFRKGDPDVIEAEVVENK